MTDSLFGYRQDDVKQVGSPRKARGGYQIRKSHLIDLMLCTMAIAGVFLHLFIGGVAVLLFLGFGAALFVFRTQPSILACRENWPLLLLPAWGAVTILWAQYPVAALRFDVQLLLTYTISISIICALPLRQTLIILAVINSAVLATVLISATTVTIFQTGEIVRVGVLGSKNNVSFFGTSALTIGALLLSLPGRSVRLNFLAIVTILIAMAAILQARSFGTLVAATGCAGIGFFLWSTSRIVRNSGVRALIYCSGLVCFVVFVVALFLIFSYAEYVSLMKTIGKDPTITGRTFIWSIGLQLIEENFWGGVGVNSFWKTGNPDAVLLWTNGKREIGAYYGFHNTYIHLGVEAGIVGTLIFLGLMIHLLRKSIFTAQREISAYKAVAASYAIFFFVKSWIETMGYSPFSGNVLFFCLIWIVVNQTHRTGWQGGM